MSIVLLVAGNWLGIKSAGYPHFEKKKKEILSVIGRFV